MGAPTKLDDLRAKKILDALKDGHSFAAAARAGGIEESTLHDWRRRGREGEAPYSEFSERVDRAEHEAEQRCVAVLRNAMESDDLKLAADTAWKWLARRRPATWAEQKGEPPPTDDEVASLVAKIRASG